jgi:hypothetical protein
MLFLTRSLVVFFFFFFYQFQCLHVGSGRKRREKRVSLEFIIPHTGRKKGMRRSDNSVSLSLSRSLRWSVRYSTQQRGQPDIEARREGREATGAGRGERRWGPVGADGGGDGGRERRYM